MLRILLIIIILYFFFFSQQIESYTAQNIATDRDHNLAIKEAFRKRCINKGYIWKESGDIKNPTGQNQPGVLSSGGIDEFTYDCLHSRETCLRDSVYPTYEDQAPQYYEWRAEPGNDRCIIGNEGFREFCEKEGLTYDPETGKCKTNGKYCMNKGLPFCNGDCFIPPLQWINEQIFGVTLARTISQASVERWITEGICRADDAIKESKREK
jgi:hypothetical protein